LLAQIAVLAVFHERPETGCVKFNSPWSVVWIGFGLVVLIVGPSGGG